MVSSVSDCFGGPVGGGTLHQQHRDTHPDRDDDEGALLLADPRSWPPGFRFHPTDEELVLYYLKRKICRRRLRLEMIGEVDLYKCEPWELPEKSVLRSGDKQWYFFSPRDRKYPNGSRSNRATRCGYWKATGKDRAISHNSRTVGMKKTLVFYHGRPPKGERTDWVMHEYTMDEQELINCNIMQDSYALCKVYRKSGPGPKNGEQYGAPFVEEWDDSDPVDNNLHNPTGGEDKLLMPIDGESGATDILYSPPIADLENFLLRVESETDMVQQHYEDFACALEEVNAETVTECSLFESPFVEINSTEQCEVGCQHELGSTGIRVQIAPSDSTHGHGQPTDLLEVMSAFDFFEQDLCEPTDGEFLEINDFDGSKPIVSRVENINANSCTHGVDVFYDPCEYLDLHMFPELVLPLNQIAPQPHYGVLENDETQKQAGNLTNELWTYDQDFIMSAAAGTNQDVLAPPPSSGAAYVGSSTSQSEVLWGQNGDSGGSSESWFGSAISAFLESVPTKPAIASENALVVRTFQRMSSFGVVGIRARNPSVAGTQGDVHVGRRKGRYGGFLFISLLVGLGAVLWMLTIGVMVKVLKTFLGRFISS